MRHLRIIRRKHRNENQEPIWVKKIQEDQCSDEYEEECSDTEESTEEAIENIGCDSLEEGQENYTERTEESRKRYQTSFLESEEQDYLRLLVGELNNI